MNYQLEQTGEQVQDTLNQAPITEQNLQNEITRSTGKDEELEAAIGNEKNRAEGVEAELQTAIGNENARAEGVEGELSTAIANEKSRAEGVEGGLRTDVEAIEEKIPTGASDQNKLATEGFVNSSVATNTADFKGTFPSLEALQTEVHDANANDYAFVISTDASGNTVYNRYKYVTGTGWVFEYALNNSSFTAAQWAAIQSGITALLVAKLAGLPTVAELTQQLNTIIASVSDEQTRAEGAEAVLRQSIADNTTAIANEKTRAQNEEGTLSTNIVNEENRAKAAEVVLQQNIDAEAILRDNADDALQAQIDGIEEKIPEQASASNQLADKSFVNSSIATNTADFKGTYNSLQELQQVSANNNDYGFVVSVDSDGNTVYNRYKYVDGTGWVFEYALNNSSFTSAQWAAIQSGITAALVAKINGLPDITALNAMFAAITNLIPSAATSENKLVDYAQMVAALATKQNTLTFDNVPTENSNNPVKSGGVYSAIATVTAAIVGLQSSKQDVLTFDQYPTAGSDNPVKSKGIYEKLSEKQATLVPGTNLDTTPTANSNNPVTSGGVKAALDLKANQSALDLKANQSTLAEEVSRAQGAESALSSRISTNATDIANLQQLYNDLQQSKPVPVTALPSTGQQQGVIYRLAGTTSYSDYMWNGSSWVLMATYNNAIDPRPKKASQNLVTSGGVFDNMGALDVSELNATENPHTLAKYADLSSALAAIPTDYQKGGMSIKFVQSSDNKYVQYRLMSNTWSTIVTNWQGVDDEPTVGSDNLVKSGGVINYGIDVIGASCDVNIEEDSQIDYPLPFLKTGNIIEITLLEDSLEPDVMFYTRTNRQAVETIGRIRVLNGVIRKTLTADSEDIYAYNNKGIGDIKFKVTKLGVREDINSIKNTLNTVAESVADNTESIENLTEYSEKGFGDYEKSYTDTNNKRYDVDFLIAGNWVEITLDGNASNNPDVVFYTQNGTTGVEDLGSITTIGGTITTKLGQNAEKIYSYSNNGELHSFTIRLLGKGEAINNDSVFNQNINFNNILNGKACILNARLYTTNWAKGKAYIIPVEEGQVVKVKGNADNATLAGFLSDCNATLRGAIPFVGSIRTINANIDFSMDVPTGAKYFVVNILAESNNQDTTPQSVYVGNIRVDTDIRNVIDGIKEDIHTDLITINSPTSGNLKQISFRDTNLKGKKVVFTLVEKNTGDVNINLGYSKTGGGLGTFGRFTQVGQSIIADCSIADYDYAYSYNDASGDYNPYVISYKVIAIDDRLDEVENRLDEVEQELGVNVIEVAAGSKDESCVNDSTYFVKTDYIQDGVIEKKYNRNIVAMNHDDFRLCDIVGVRRIYNKYGFAANFNFMLMGFASVDDKNKRIEATKKLLREGNKIGLHNYMGGSYWWMNPLFDIRPDGSASYAPTLSELQGSNVDHTGINTFGTNVTATTKFSDCKFESLPNDINKVVVSATADEWRAVIGFCCVLFNTDTRTILNLNDEIETKTSLEWAEYWYNELIDNTLGYSTSGDYVSKYAADYKTTADGVSATGSYPDTTHLENGKIVFFDDVDNPHYNDADYQKVGYFDKGLFKGCATSRNCEVVGRIIDIATAFCRHYYGMVYFDNFGRHGEKFSYNLWTGNGFNYDNRDKTILTWDTQKIYITSVGKFKSLFEILKDHNIKMTNHGNNGYSMTYNVVGQKKLFLGQSEIVGDYDNQADYISFIDFFGPANASISEMTYSKFLSFAAQHKDNWLKWAYENAGQTISNGDGDTYQMYTYIKSCVDVIRRSLGTGKIPAFSVDTVRQSPNVMAAVEILCQFCWANDISIVPVEVARKIANTPRDIISNLFPNPSFGNILLPMLDGSSSSVDAYLPDSWEKYINDNDYVFNVEYSQENSRREFSVTRTSNQSYGAVATRVYGLGPGKYKFSCYYKTTNEEVYAFTLFKRYNRDGIYDSASNYIVNDSGHNSQWTLVEQEFTIEPPYRDLTDNNPVNRLCDGYANNVAYIEMRVFAKEGKTTSIALPSITKIG